MTETDKSFEDNPLGEVEQIEFKLSKPIKIHKKGQLIEADILVVKAPSFEERNDVYSLQALLVRASINTPKKEKEEEDDDDDEKKIKDEEAKKEKGLDENDESGILMGLFVYGGKEAEYITNKFKSLFQNVITIEGEPLTNHYLKQISLKDFRIIAGRYIRIFLLPSLS